MRVTLWGTRGSLATPGPDTSHYGGETSCVEVRDGADNILVLDAGTGIRRLGKQLPPDIRRIDILLTHLHMDHIQGLAFFAPLFNPAIETHIWGPRSTTLTLRERIARYVSPPLFPVHLRDVAPHLLIQEIPQGDFDIEQFRVYAELVCHPNPTLGYRIELGGGAMTYLPDHEPALGLRNGYVSGDWTSGYVLAEGTDVLIHDSQYSEEEYRSHVGWGHSSMEQAFTFAGLAGAKELVPFHHDPSHTDAVLDRLIEQTVKEMHPPFAVTPGIEGVTLTVGSS
ncbi:MAG TPA: MBL fold metallo-hydrolase [Chloroflexota bacterium]